MQARGSVSFCLTITLLLSLAACTSPAVPPTATTIPTATATAAPTATPAPTTQPGAAEHQLTINGLARSYLLYVPSGIDHLQPVPAVFAFHGFGGDPDWMVNNTGFNSVADKNSFLIVYPQGSGDDHSWNAGSCCGSAVDNKVDETAFVRQILADVGASFHIDPKRIYAMGHSNGAFLADRLACDMSDTIAAIAPLSGALMYDECQPQQPVAVMHVHGLADTIVPFNGGTSSLDSTLIFAPMKDTIATWVRLDGCTGAPQVETLKNVITHTVYAGCRGGTAVELYAIEYLGHDIPPFSLLPPERIWDFFAVHPKP